MFDTKYNQEAFADLPGVTFSVIRQMVLGHAKLAKLKVLEDVEQSLTVETQHGLIGIRAGHSTSVSAMVAANNERWLFIMKTAVVEQLRQVMPTVADAMRWSNGPAEGTLPLNFIFVRVISVVPLGSVFLRVMLEGDDLSSYGDDAIHFRLLQPSQDGQPLWPTVAANGSTVWPDGEGALHKPVYTARSINYSTNTLECDVFIHDGGRTSDWAQLVLSDNGSHQIVGLVGPLGGGILNTDKVLMASDETGFPAVARLLENLSPNVKGQLFLEADDGAACEYPFTIPVGIEVVWLARKAHEKLADAVLTAMPHHSDSKIWFAGEREQARRVRDAAKATGHDAKDLRISGFWSANS
ncbi:MAG: siderophore-interacting protein [Octadecabacter sp.]|nr:siderophore-interacting protein [Octadecabacter sp.]